MAQYDDLNTRQIWIVGIVSAVITGVTILAVQVLYYALRNSHEAASSEQAEYTQSVAYIGKQTAELHQYGRDKETGNIQIPIDQAFNVILKKIASKPSAEPADANNGTDEA